ncbi:MAG: RNase adapter RapZ [Peptococcaceae bacterium]|nr:RNase adapter RapZ [Peptococcaceae bacterium]
MIHSNFVIITGLSGAGKSNAVKVFEDLGYFCIDNLPAPLIPKFAELCLQSAGKVSKIALVIDIRGDLFLDELNQNLNELSSMNIPYQILFLEASDEVLIQRFKETRRNHPLSPQGTISEGILLERQKLSELRGRAHKIIDTSRLKASELRSELRSQWADISNELSVSIITFGYKHGIPIDTDLLMDVRFIPNPFYIPELRPLTGRDPAVQEYVYSSAESQEFLQKFSDLLKFLLPNYSKEGKTHITIGIGCTGGQHRSIALGIKIGQLLEQEGYTVNVKHRDN